MIYPQSFEQKIGFDEVRAWLLTHCSSSLGKSKLELMSLSQDYEAIRRSLDEVQEMRQVLEVDNATLPSLNLVDGRDVLHSIRPDRTYMEASDLVELGRMLEALHALHHYFVERETSGDARDESLVYHYPALASYLRNAPLFPKIESAIKNLFDSEGRIKDTASRELLRIRQALRETEKSLSGILQRILRVARSEGWVESDAQPTIREGRLVLPISPQHKRKIKGIVHDESATGKTVFVEPVEMVEANNQIRELESEERRELIRILQEIASRLRPNISHLLRAYDLLAHFDFVLAKARWAKQTEAICPELSDSARLEWYGARHPLLERNLKSSGRELVPLDVRLDEESGRILLISGPNAGGKSVCLKTVGLLQYMLQCGLPIPVLETTRAGLFHQFFIDIGDEQSMEDDLSTYSSHLSNMKYFERESTQRTLMLIDEFGGGTEPTIGGAIAEALLERFNEKGVYGLITTHYQNLKSFAEATPGLINGAMLYDRHLMRPLFRLSIGRPGSSFAIEIARKIGLPEAVIARASEAVGSTYIDMDKYLQDIVRDKRYWETKRQSIRKEEKRLEELAERYAKGMSETEEARRSILAEARAKAERIVQEASSRIERTIKEIREAEAEKNRTQSIRAELRSYQESLSQTSDDEAESDKATKARRELEKLMRRRERRGKQGKAGGDTEADILRKLRASSSANVSMSQSEEKTSHLKVGDLVRLDSQDSVATIIAINDKEVTIALGMMKMTVAPSRLRLANNKASKKGDKNLRTVSKPITGAQSVIDMIHDKRLHFRTDLDIRGMRLAEGVSEVARFVDDALQLGIERLRILHGTGTGALREGVRQYLSGVPSVHRYADEHVQLGGAGITVVELK